MPELGCNRCSTKVLRPERCVVWDGSGHPCTACTEDIKLEKEIKGLENSIENLHIRRRVLRTVMNKNHDRFIHRFPPEIASQIFIHHSPPILLFGKQWITRSPPLHLGAVCQKWRQLAWATPELWTSLRISLGEYGNYEALPQLVTEWLERSATLPLTIKFVDDSYQMYGDEPEVHSEVINILNGHSARWHDMYFDLPDRHLRRLCGSSQGTHVLHQLVFSGDRWSADEPNISDHDLPIFSMKYKPSPTHFRLRTFPLASVDISWNFITVASLDEISVGECVEFLRRSPLLESLSLNRIKHSPSRIFPVSKTRIPCLHLHSLELLKIDETTVVAEILDSMHLPALERWIHCDCPLSLDNMISFAEYSSLSLCLKEFRINGNASLYEAVTDLLHRLSSLQVLQLKFQWFFRQPPINEELLHVLCAPMGEPPPFLPHLQSLEFNSSFPISWESIPQILVSPSRRSLKIKVDYICYNDSENIPYEAAKRLLEMVEQGFDLTIFRNGQDVLEELKEATATHCEQVVKSEGKIRGCSEELSTKWINF
jgi:hypothetical protein